MIRKRFPRDRRWRIAAWTAIAIAWTSAIVARTLGGGGAEAAESAPRLEPAPVTITVPVEAATALPVPTLPEDGLVVLRYTPGPKPEPEVRRVVVTQQAPATQATAPAPPPTTKTSSGS